MEGTCPLRSCVCFLRTNKTAFGRECPFFIVCKDGTLISECRNGALCNFIHVTVARDVAFKVKDRRIQYFDPSKNVIDATFYRLS